MRPLAHSRLLLLLIAAVVAAAQPAAAQGVQPEPSAVEGVVVQVDGGEVIVDLGQAHGLPDDPTLEVFRRIEVTHPVSEKTMVDRFPIGALPLAKVGDQLSIATGWSQLERKPKVGDYVVWRAEPARAERGASAAASAPADPAASPPDCPEPTREPALVDLERTFQRSLGEPLTERIALWDAYQTAYPDGPYAKAVSREMDWLRQRLAAQRDAGDPSIKPEPTPTVAPLIAYATAPGRVFVDEPVQLVATVDTAERVEQIRLFVRRAGQPAYDELGFERAGDFNWRVALPASWHEGPGRLDYFIEAVRDDGELQLLSGSASRPRQIVVARKPTQVDDSADRSRATGVFEYVNFKGGQGDDEYLRFESDYRYRIGRGALEAFSVGVGIFDGRGASVEAIEAGQQARDLTVSYGFAGLEFALHDWVGVSGRLLVGDAQGSDGATLDDAFGIRGELRVGELDGTRLLVGASRTDAIGSEAWIRMHLEPIDRVPMHGEVVVTNLPVGEDLGVSLGYGAGYAFTDWFALMGRIGWNARTINYQGPSAGLGTVLQW